MNNIGHIDHIDILICTFNPNGYLTRLVESIYLSAHRIRYINLYISDDSLHDIRYLIPTRKDVNIKYWKGPRKGAAFNFLFSMNKINPVSGWLFLADQDDIWEKDKVTTYIDIIEANPTENINPYIIFSDSSLIDSNGVALESSFFKYQKLSSTILETDDILFENCVQGATLCINNKMIELVRRSIYFLGTEDIIMHDWWIAILARYYGDYYFIRKPMLKYRQHDSNVIGAQKRTSFLKKIMRPLDAVYKITALKKQYTLCLKFIDIEKDNFGQRKLKISLYSKLKFFLFNFI